MPHYENLSFECRHHGSPGIKQDIINIEVEGISPKISRNTGNRFKAWKVAVMPSTPRAKNC
jgi:hypothetical protein